MFNPFKYKYLAQLIHTQGDKAQIRLQAGALTENLELPLSILPKEIQPGEDFVLTFQSKKTAEYTEAETLKALLKELIL